MISSLIEWPHRSTCHHPSRHNRGEATGTWIPRQIEDIPSIISIQSASNSLISLTGPDHRRMDVQSDRAPRPSRHAQPDVLPGSLVSPPFQDPQPLGCHPVWNHYPLALSLSTAPRRRAVDLSLGDPLGTGSRVGHTGLDRASGPSGGHVHPEYRVGGSET